MKYCKQCGKEVFNAQAVFCINCGYKFEYQSDNYLADQLDKQIGKVATLSSSALETIKIKLRDQGGIKQLILKYKVAFAVALGLLVLIIAGYQVGETLTSKERLINRFETAMKNDDVNTFQHVLTISDDTLKIDTVSAGALLKYLKKNPDQENALIHNLHQSDGEENRYSNKLINLKKGPKLLFFDTYKLVVEPVYVTINTNYKDTTLLLNGTELTKADKPNYSQKFGPYLPGIYEIEAKLNTGYIDLTRKENVVLLNKQNTVALDLKGQNVSINTGLNKSTGLEASLIINDKSVGLNPLLQTQFGPVLTDGSVVVAMEAEFPWGKIRTANIPIQSDRVSLNPANNTEFKSGLMEATSRFFNSYLQAYTSGNVEILTTASADYKTDLQQKINSIKRGSTQYSGKYLSSTFDLDSFKLWNDSGKWYSSMQLVSRFEEGFNALGQEIKTQPSDHTSLITLQYDELKKSWLVNKIADIYGFSSKNTKVITEEKPQTFRSAWAPEIITGAVDVPQMQKFISLYLNSSVVAINKRDFSQVSDLLNPTGKAYKESAAYIDYLKGQGITEELLQSTVKAVNQEQDGSYTVTSTDSYNIISKNGTRTAQYESVYKVVQSDGKLKVDELLSTKETN